MEARLFQSGEEIQQNLLQKGNFMVLLFSIDTLL